MSVSIHLAADLSRLRADLDELLLRLEKPGLPEDLFGELLAKVKEALAVGGDQVARFASVSAVGACDVVVEARIGDALEAVLATLRTVQGDIAIGHGASRDVD